MTPTEQDKELEQALDNLSELNKLGGRGHGDLADTCYVCGISPSKLLAYITADRKRVALEARVNEIVGILSHNVTSGESVKTNISFPRVLTLNERYVELKAQQEEI